MQNENQKRPSVTELNAMDGQRRADQSRQLARDAAGVNSVLGEMQRAGRTSFFFGANDMRVAQIVSAALGKVGNDIASAVDADLHSAEPAVQAHDEQLAKTQDTINGDAPVSKQAS